jgi:hypothetical protein
VKKKSDDNGGVGQMDDVSKNQEAGGRAKRKVLMSYWRCGAANYVDPDWKWFTCWKCGMTYPDAI